jgi:hypothetical protein
MAITAYTLAQKVHFAATPQDNSTGDIAGDINDVVILDSVSKVGTLYRSGVQTGPSFPLTSAQATALVTAGWLTANTTFSGVPGGKGVAAGWTAITGWTAGQFASARAGLTSTASTQGATNNALLALIADLTAAGIIGA